MIFTVNLQTTQLRQAIQRELGSPEHLLNNYGEVLFKENVKRNDRGVAPDGTPWPPLSPMTIGSAVWNTQKEKTFRKKGTLSLATARKIQSRKRLLVDNRDLRGSFPYQVQGRTLVLGFQDHKAIWHQEGTGTHGPKGAAYEIRPKVKKALAFGGLVRKRVAAHPGIPARVLLGFPSGDQKLLVDVTGDYFQAMFNGGSNRR
jgi:phage gpG-like protein